MTTPPALEAFSALAPEEKTDFLVRFAHALTILARDTYEVGQTGLTDPARMRRLNEVQHRVIGHLMALLRDAPERYPDDVLWRILLEHPDDGELQRQLQETAHSLLSPLAAP